MTTAFPTGPRPSPGKREGVSYTPVPHPDHPPNVVRGVSVEMRGGWDDLLLTYRVDGAECLVIPEWRSPTREDGLWRTTCFELFVMTNDSGGYAEFNFSPSTQWAAYAFDGPRTNMRALARDVAPHIQRLPNGIEVDCDLGGLPPGDLRIGLSAVIEEIDGTKSYWALAHPDGPPDFHHPACFVATLPAPRDA